MAETKRVIVAKAITSEARAFRLSRIEAEGWRAAHKHLLAENLDDEEKIAALNPHHTKVERARWLKGFRNAIGKA